MDVHHFPEGNTMPEETAPIEDRDANIRMTVQSIIDASLDAMFERFDQLKKRNINDDDMVAALRYLGDIELLDEYAEWADIDIREDDNTTTNPVVPDPGDAPSYEPLARVMASGGALTYSKPEGVSE
jgi:hypothetical protein